MLDHDLLKHNDPPQIQWVSGSFLLVGGFAINVHSLHLRPVSLHKGVAYTRGRGGG